MMRFVILWHDWPEAHYDLLLEAVDCAWAWRLPVPPEAGREITACRNRDHRLLYLEYEGPLTENRGRVRRWDAGSYEGTLATVPLRLKVLGERLRGTLVLEPQDEALWHLQYLPDEQIANGPGTS
jgi:hypothetical protein